MEKFDAELQDRLVRYASIDTQSEETSYSTPSTVIQYELLNLLQQDHHALGMRPPVPETLLEKTKISGTEKWG